MFQHSPTRTPEQGHTAECLASAMKCAVENARDAFVSDARGNADMAQHEFRLWAQRNDALTWADQYLADGTCTCTCPPWHCTATRIIGSDADPTEVGCDKRPGHGGPHRQRDAYGPDSVTLLWMRRGVLLVCTCDNDETLRCPTHQGGSDVPAYVDEPDTGDVLPGGIYDDRPRS